MPRQHLTPNACLVCRRKRTKVWLDGKQFIPRCVQLPGTQNLLPGATTARTDTQLFSSVTAKYPAEGVDREEKTALTRIRNGGPKTTLGPRSRGCGPSSGRVMLSLEPSPTTMPIAGKQCWIGCVLATLPRPSRNPYLPIQRTIESAHLRRHRRASLTTQMRLHMASVPGAYSVSMEARLSENNPSTSSPIREWAGRLSRHLILGGSLSLRPSTLGGHLCSLCPLQGCTPLRLACRGARASRRRLRSFR